jgi:ATP-dependent RNA helicase RhlE
MNSFSPERLGPAPARTAPSTPASPFADLGLMAPLVRAVVNEGYETPTPIQTQSIPPLLDGRDLLGCAQTGTGKTAAFVLPILQRLSTRAAHKKIRALILTPTRELAAQIGERTGCYGEHLGVRHTVIFGGVGQRPQEQALARGPEIVIATPGRLLDLMSQGFVKLDALEVFVLDEADRMLDMGFIHDVRRVIRELPKKRQTLLFSATMPRDIDDLAQSILTNPARVAVTPVASTTELVTQSVYFVGRADKRVLLERVLRAEGVERTLVFTRTKHGANRVAEQLTRSGVRASAIHGNKSQSARERALEDFRAGRIPVLVATDIAARGIDIDGISHVVNFDLPNIPESYVHRIGRTGRAGATGTAVSFCDGEERAFLRDIEHLIKRRVPVADAALLPEAPRVEQHAHAAPSRDPQTSQGYGQRSSQGYGQRSSQGHGQRSSQGHGQQTSQGHGQQTSQGHGQQTSQGHGQQTSQGHGQQTSQGHGQQTSQASPTGARRRPRSFRRGPR